MEALVAAAKVGKYATSEGGDTLKMIERPSGGVSFVLADGQLSRKPAKAIANVVTRKALSLLADDSRAADDITVLEAAIQPGSGDDVRPLSVQLSF